MTGRKPPRSHIEQDITDALRVRGTVHLHTGISWVRSHIGIKGNELADSEVAAQSFIGQLLSKTLIATETGIRLLSKQARASHRAIPSLGLDTLPYWPKQPLSAYTRMRTYGPRTYEELATPDRQIR